MTDPHDVIRDRHEEMVRAIIKKCREIAKGSLPENFDDAVRVSFDEVVLAKSEAAGYTLDETIDRCVEKTKSAVPRFFYDITDPETRCSGCLKWVKPAEFGPNGICVECRPHDRGGNS